MPSGAVVVLTQEAEDNAALAALLAPFGITALGYPCLATRYRPFRGGHLDSGRNLTDYDVIIFTSKRAVTGVQPARGAIAAAGLPVACVGATTAQAVRQLLELEPALTPASEQTGANLAQLIAEAGLKVRRALYFCGNRTTGGLQAGLAQAGIEVDEQQVYENYAPDLEPLKPGVAALVVFASPSAARRFFQANPAWRDTASCIAIGPATSACLSELGARRAGQAAQPDKLSLAQAIINCLTQEQLNA